MKRLMLIIGIALLATACRASAQSFDWSELPAIPDALGVGGPFAGVDSGALILVGGANFPNGMPWENGDKVWYDEVLVLESQTATQWLIASRLPHPLAYGASLSTANGLLLIGGRDETQAYDTVYRLRWDTKTKQISLDDSLPRLPMPSFFHAAAMIGNTIYVAAGQSDVSAPVLNHAFWALDLDAASPAWAELDPWPGAARVKAVAVAQTAGTAQPYFYFFSGEIPTVSAAGDPQYQYLTDGYRFNPAAKPGEAAWRPMADAPVPVAASTALPSGQAHVLVFSGSTGEHVYEPQATQPEFPAEVRAYHTITDTWVVAGKMPQPVVTTQAVRWGDNIVLPSGEIRPGVRTSKVQMATTKPPKGVFGALNMAVLIGYLAALVGVGAYFSRREKGTADFFLAGKRIPWWATGLSIYATQLSAITFLALPAMAYSTNWVYAPAYLAMIVMAPVIIYCYLPFFCRLNITTAYEYLELRFGLGVRLFGSLSFILFQILRMAIVVYLPALALTAITGLNVYACIVIMGVLAILYTVLGGMEAVVWTDVVQALVLLGGLAISLVIVLNVDGGIGAILSEARAAGKLKATNWTWSYVELATWSLLIGQLLNQLGPYTTDQAVIQRYLSTRDEKSAAKGIWLNALLSVPVVVLFFLMGTALFVYFKAHPEIMPITMQNDQAFPLFIAHQLPAGVSGLVIAGIFAASMSSLDSSMHSIATAVTVDFFRRFEPKMNDAYAMSIARIIIAIAGCFAMIAAVILVTFDIQSLFHFFQKILGLTTSALVGIFMLGIFTRRATGVGALTGAAAGTLALAYATYMTQLNTYLLPVVGIGTTVLTGYLVSFTTPAPDAKRLQGLTLRTIEKKV